MGRGAALPRFRSIVAAVGSPSTDRRGVVSLPMYQPYLIGGLTVNRSETGQRINYRARGFSTESTSKSTGTVLSATPPCGNLPNPLPRKGSQLLIIGRNKQNRGVFHRKSTFSTAPAGVDSLTFHSFHKVLHI